MELTERLLTVASFVRRGSFLMDVGTDHAYLPIYLAENGVIRASLASDIHEGPCESARRHVSECGLADKIRVKRADGLIGLEPDGMTDIVIAGMGGTLISEIIEKAEFVKNGEIHLILQPMRNVAELRAYLYSHGFDIIGEALAREDERIYEIICAAYDGKERDKSAISLLLGEKNIENKKVDAALFNAFCEKHVAALCKKINGMRKGGADASAEQELLLQIKSVCTDIK